MRVVVLLLLTLAGVPAFAQDEAGLIALVNAYRTGAPQPCENKRVGPVGALAPNNVLSRAPLPASGALVDALRTAGYSAESAYIITVSGPDNVEVLMKAIARRYCRALLDPLHTEIGVRRTDREWRIILARRLLAPNLGDWRDAGKEIFRLSNALRVVARACGTRQFPAAPPLKWNDALAKAALAHSRDMAEENYLDHVDKSGSKPGDRATREGYVWKNVGENIASGQGSAEKAVGAWLSSPVHCATLMDPAFAEMGAAYVTNMKSDAIIYWTQVFGTSR